MIGDFGSILGPFCISYHQILIKSFCFDVIMIPCDRRMHLVVNSDCKDISIDLQQDNPNSNPNPNWLLKICSNF